jgi:hypothetical protein
LGIHEYKAKPVEIIYRVKMVVAMLEAGITPIVRDKDLFGWI